MEYWGSAAVDLDALERRAPEAQPERRPSFEVVEGAGLDARVRQGVSPRFMSRIKLAVALVSLVVCLGVCRVALSSATVSVLQDNRALQSTIETSQATESELKINRSVLSASSRIVRIATQNYGMTLAASTDEISLGDTSQATASASDGDVAQASAVADSSSDES